MMSNNYAIVFRQHSPVEELELKLVQNCLYKVKTLDWHPLVTDRGPKPVVHFPKCIEL